MKNSITLCLSPN